MSKRVLITGIGGFVGSNVARYIRQKRPDFEIIGIDSFVHKGDSFRLKGMRSDGVQIITHDLTVPFTERHLRSMGEIDWVFNIASESHVDRSIMDPVPFIKNNVAIAVTMGELARILKPKVFLQMSTDECFGPAIDDHFHTEWEVHRPSNPYSASKCAQDDILFSYWRCYGVPVIRTRTMNIFGPMQDSEKFIPMIIKNIKEKQPVTIHGSLDRVGSRMYLDVRNLADAWLFLAENRTPTLYKDDDSLIQQYDAYNITGQEEISNMDLAIKISDIIGTPGVFKFQDFHSARPGHDRRYALSGKKIFHLGWKHPFEIEESLKDTVQFYLNNQEWTL